MSTDHGTEAKGKVSRRGFLKILGSASAAGAVGCADSATQNIFPNVQPTPEQIPGVATWFRSTCTECSAGCGIEVRVRDGRAVKVEGSRENPINRGGLCALGQSSVQHLYDPDRIRQPLSRTGSGDGMAGFEPASWDKSMQRVAEFLKSATGKRYFLTGELSGYTLQLVEDWCKGFGFTHVTFDPLQPVSVAKAAELSFGKYGVPTYQLDKADVVLNFGADYLETWVSPVEYSQGWASARRASTPLKVIHVEPRLSLTGANADVWLSAKPGTEVRIALVLIKLLLERGKGAGMDSAKRAQIAQLVSSVHIDDVVRETGVSLEKLLLVSQLLFDSESPVVLAGGTASATTSPLPLLVAANLLNLLLESVGKTVQLAEVRQPATSVEKMKQLIDDLEAQTVDLLFTYGTNPAFTLPTSFGYRYASKKAGIVSKTNSGGIVVALSSHFDETAELADVILPVSTSLESWGDVQAKANHHSLVQPAMLPVFDTKGFGDILLAFNESVKNADGSPKVATEAKTMESYLKDQWTKVFQGLKGSGGAKLPENADRFWLESLERGGYFGGAGSTERERIEIDPGVFALNFTSATFQHPQIAHDAPILYPFPSVKTFDGRAANRPWLQELPDPVTQIVWDSWAEMHPETAKKYKLEHGDLVTVENYLGTVNVPVYVSQYVHRDIVAVPLGQGHQRYGRWAQKVGDGNVMSLLPAVLSKDAAGGLALLSTRASIRRAPGDPKLVILQGSDSQHKRELARTTKLTPSLLAARAGNDQAHGEAHGHGTVSHGTGAHGSDGHAAHHEPKQMYEQRAHPVYEWGMSVDLASCTGCSACVVACYAENNIPVVGKEICSQGREMSWLRIERYLDNDEGEELTVNFLPMMCQHCNNAPCEPVCPVYATYHNEEGLNQMVYNRCVGTRYCSNNCSYKVRRFNWFEYSLPEPLALQLNPDVTKRATGVMEKCTFCVQRIQEAKDRAKDVGRLVQDGEVQPACAQSCPTQAIVFGNLNDPSSKVSRLHRQDRAYKILDHHINTQPAISYLEDVKYRF